MSHDGRRSSFDAARREAALSMEDLWLRYVSLGGTAPLAEMAAFVGSAAAPNRRDHDLVAQALNERFLDMGRDMPVPYFHETD